MVPTITITRTIAFTLQPRDSATVDDAESYAGIIASATKLFATDTVPTELVAGGFSGTIQTSVYHAEQSITTEQAIADPVT
jgi:hypothetical protein